MDDLNSVSHFLSNALRRLHIFEYEGFIDESLTRLSRKCFTCFLLRREQKSQIIDLNDCSIVPHARIIEYFVRYGAALLVAPRLSISVFSFNSSDEQSSRSASTSAFCIIQPEENIGSPTDPSTNRVNPHCLFTNRSPVVLIQQQLSPRRLGIWRQRRMTLGQRKVGRN